MIYKSTHLQTIIQGITVTSAIFVNENSSILAPFLTLLYCIQGIATSTLYKKKLQEGFMV